eukprot:SAG25_NODE_198_length_12124_cov_20.420208_10_plen_167_part_00
MSRRWYTRPRPAWAAANSWSSARQAAPPHAPRSVASGGGGWRRRHGWAALAAAPAVPTPLFHDKNTQHIGKSQSKRAYNVETPAHQPRRRPPPRSGHMPAACSPARADARGAQRSEQFALGGVFSTLQMKGALGLVRHLEHVVAVRALQRGEVHVRAGRRRRRLRG